RVRTYREIRLRSAARNRAQGRSGRDLSGLASLLGASVLRHGAPHLDHPEHHTQGGLAGSEPRRPSRFPGEKRGSPIPASKREKRGFTMHFTKTRQLAVLMGSASLFTVANALSAHAQQMTAQAQMAQAEEIPENVLITGSLIRGAAAVGVPVTNLGVQDFQTTGNPTIGDLFRTVPVPHVAPGPPAVNSG